MPYHLAQKCLIFGLTLQIGVKLYQIIYLYAMFWDTTLWYTVVQIMWLVGFFNVILRGHTQTTSSKETDRPFIKRRRLTHRPRDRFYQ